MDFETTMARIDALVREQDPGAALGLCEELERCALDPVERGWVADYTIRCLYALDRHEEALDRIAALDAPDIPPRNLAWLSSVGAEMSQRRGDVDGIGTHAARAFELRCLDTDRDGAALAGRTAAALFARSGEPERFTAWFHGRVAWGRTLEAGSGPGLTAHLALSILAREPRPPEPLAAELARLSDLVEAASAGDLDALGEHFAVLSPDSWSPAHPGTPTPLHAAAFAGQAHAVRWLLEHGVSVDVPNCQGRTALHHAADRDDGEAVRALLAAGAGHPGDQHRLTPLHVAAWQDHRHAVRALLAGGAPLGAMDVNGDTPLALAASSDVPEILRLLLEAGAAVDVRNHLGQTALMRAAMEGRTACVRLLRDAGADATARDRNGLTARDWALHESFPTVVAAL